ncbi:hypothetical protein PBY51_016956 [Eleginops maclovinus]|uniref:Uncharacterized protein n=1 Tax=Eleginops maclovinus TaxID=56733 RepID=A0AAN7W9L0_ELEMC|nr:hypothetical protein PBY51_016956 [Eleginops maclovinus]
MVFAPRWMCGSGPFTLSILMERRQGGLPCGEGEIGVGRVEWGVGGSHLCVIKAVLMGGAREGKRGGQSPLSSRGVQALLLATKRISPPALVGKGAPVRRGGGNGSPCYGTMESPD